MDQLPAVGPAALTMGVFDGVHAGHRALLAATRAEALKRGVGSVAIVFDPHPDEVLRPGSVVPRLAPLATNLRRIEGEDGVDRALPLRFDDALRRLEAESFLAAISHVLELRALVMTPASAFGRGRRGTVELMRTVGATAGFEVITVAPVVAAGAIVSSSRLRDAVQAGDLSMARTLGASAYLTGQVVRGDGRGRALGFPTANLAFDYLPVMPPRGIYAGRVAVAERSVGPQHPALVSIGIRPTFHPDGETLVEAYLLDYDGDLYGSELEIELEARLRDEERFDSVEALVRQMRADEARGRQILDVQDLHEPAGGRRTGSASVWYDSAVTERNVEE